MALKSRVPKQLALPLGLTSLIVMVLGLVVGYILTMVGLTTWWGHTLPADELSTVQALSITGIGIGCIIAGYLGWKGFLYFSY